MQQQILDMLLNQEEISWKALLYNLVETEQMDPWDVNVSLLTKKYIEAIKKMQEHDLRISGKILLAAAILLKMKSTHLLEHDFSEFDSLLNQSDDTDDELFEEGAAPGEKRLKEKYQLIPRNPQPRTRKVSINDLISALQKALATKRKVLAQQRPRHMEIPKRKVDIMDVIRELYYKIVEYEKKEKENLTFTRLLPAGAGKLEKVRTFVPLLHLENLQKIETQQQEPFEEIYIKLLKIRIK